MQRKSAPPVPLAITPCRGGDEGEESQLPVKSRRPIKSRLGGPMTHRPLDRRRFLRHLAAGIAAFPRIVGPPRRERRPNILFCIADDATWCHMGAYGCRWVQTPAFDRVGREGDPLRAGLHPQCQMRPFPGLHPDRQELLAAGGGGQPLVLLPGQVHHLHGGPGPERLPRGLHRQGLGPLEWPVSRGAARGASQEIPTRKSGPLRRPGGSRPATMGPTSSNSWRTARGMPPSASGMAASNPTGATSSERESKRAGRRPTRSPRCRPSGRTTGSSAPTFWTMPSRSNTSTATWAGCSRPWKNGASWTIRWWW